MSNLEEYNYNSLNELPEDIQNLIEDLAEGVHDARARERMSQGWTYGEMRDDERKKTPALLPYSDLPEAEKKIDRNTVIVTLNLISRYGYKLTKAKKSRTKKTRSDSPAE